LRYNSAMNTPEPIRCWWCGEDPTYIAYHDHEWGVPVHDDRRWFEFLLLEGAQAGLSWITILRKREAYRAAFDQFDPQLIADYDDGKITALLANAGIVRNRLKITAAIRNAQVFLAIQQEYGSFDNYIWRFVDGQPIRNRFDTRQQVPAATAESHALSKDLIKRGMTFVGPTICYALMQATGMVNDHLVDCFRYSQVSSSSYAIIQPQRIFE
jgi:DNA-3-methyladenine glycosylase I